MKMFSVVVAAVVACFAGCKSLPSEDVMRGTAESIGRAAGYAVELSKTKAEVKDAIVKVLDIVAEVVPETNQTFVAAWKPLIDEEIDKLVAADKIKAEDAVLAKSVLYIACDGVDLVFTRYPKAREYKNLVSAATDGFVSGFKSVVTFAGSAKAAYDEKAYEVLKKKFENRYSSNALISKAREYAGFFVFYWLFAIGESCRLRRCAAIM